MTVRYLDLGDYLLIAEAVLDVPADKLARLERINLAESALAAPAAGFGGVDAYPDLTTKAAVLCWHLVKNHPLPDGNKRAAFLTTIEFVERNGSVWTRSSTDPENSDQVIRGVASGKIEQEQLRSWIAQRLSGPE